MNFFTKLSAQQLRSVAGMCAGVAVLMVAAGLLGGTVPHGGSLAAATALGDIQGVPPGETGSSYPDETNCFYLTDGKYPYNSSPACRAWPSTSSGHTVYPQIYTGIFSVNAAATPSTGSSVYLTSDYTPSYEDDRDMGTACTSGNTFSMSGGSGSGICTDSNGNYVATPCTQYSTPSGYSGIKLVTSQTGDGGATGECYAYRTIGASLSGSQTTVGSTPTVAPGAGLTLQWSCLPTRSAIYNNCSYNQFDSHCNAYQTTAYSITPANDSSGGGPGFAPSGVTGRQTISAPSSDGTYYYSLSCIGGGWGLPTMTVPVVVTTPYTVTLYIKRSSDDARVTSSQYVANNTSQSGIPTLTVGSSDTVSVSWSTTGASSCSLYKAPGTTSARDSSSGVGVLSGTQQASWASVGTPGVTTTYTLACNTSSGGYQTSVTAVVPDSMTLYIQRPDGTRAVSSQIVPNGTNQSGIPTVVAAQGDVISASWSTSGASSCSLYKVAGTTSARDSSAGIGVTTGTQQGAWLPVDTPTVTSTYTLTCNLSSGGYQTSVTVLTPAMIGALSLRRSDGSTVVGNTFVAANEAQTNIPTLGTSYGEAVQASWTTTGASSCSLYNWPGHTTSARDGGGTGLAIGTRQTTWIAAGSPTSNTSYTLACADANGTWQDTIIVSPCSTGQVLYSGSQTKTIFLTSGTTWTVPSDWNSSSNTIEAIGGGGGGGNGGSFGSGQGGAGGEYRKIINASLSANTTVSIQIGSGGASATAGGATYLKDNSSNIIIKANGGAGGLSNSRSGSGSSGGSGGVGAVGYVGGVGGAPGTGGNAGGGGGGAGGPNGAGAAGGYTPGSGQAGGSGGGGGGGGTAGSYGSGVTTGGTGGTNYSGTGAGAGGTNNVRGGNGTSGGGGGGGGLYAGGGTGGNGVEWAQTSNGAVAGSGGGGGAGAQSGMVGGTGGLYGGGGGGGSYPSAGNAGGSGAQGIIVITYTNAPQCVPQCPNGQGPAGQCTSCNAGYTLSGGNCVSGTPSGNISGQLLANPNRVRSGDSAVLSWTTTGMTSCTVKDEAGNTISALTSSSNTPVTNITSKHTYTLSCTDGTNTYTSQANITLIPVIREL